MNARGTVETAVTEATANEIMTNEIMR